MKSCAGHQYISRTNQEGEGRGGGAHGAGGQQMRPPAVLGCKYDAGEGDSAPVWRALRRDVGQDQNGGRRCILYFSE